MKMVNCLPEFEYFFTVFLKNRNFISKIRISKVTDYAALNRRSSRFAYHRFVYFLGLNFEIYPVYVSTQ